MSVLIQIILGVGTGNAKKNPATLGRTSDRKQGILRCYSPLRRWIHYSRFGSMNAKKNPAPGRRTGSRLLEGGASLRRLVSIIAVLVDGNKKKSGEVSSSVWGG